MELSGDPAPQYYSIHKRKPAVDGAQVPEVELLVDTGCAMLSCRGPVVGLSTVRGRQVRRQLITGKW